MLRLSAIFIVLCMVLIAASVGATLYLLVGLNASESMIVAVAILTGLAIYHAVTSRLHDRFDIGGQIADLSRGTGDLARQVAELNRRTAALEGQGDKIIDGAAERARGASEAIAGELAEVANLVKQLAETVALHELKFAGAKDLVTKDPGVKNADAAAARDGRPQTPAESAGGEAAPAAPGPAEIPEGQREMIATIRDAIDSGRVDLYLQPIVTLPQRKVRYYEAMSRLKAESGEVVAAADFLPYAEAGSLMPKLDGLSVLRCVQVVRRLLLKNRDIGLFCNLSGASLTDSEFPQLLEFLEANRAIASALVFEFTQSAVRAMGPLEHESLAALAERGFRFSMDNLTDLRVEPRELNERGFRFIKVSAMLLLNRVGAASTDIHPADFSDLLGRFGIDLIAERIESESTVVDLLDYDVRFGQGYLFSPPRPVRAEALQGAAGEAVKAVPVATAPPTVAPETVKPEAANGVPAAPAPVPQAAPPPQPPPAPASDSPFAAVSGALAQFARAGNGRG